MKKHLCVDNNTVVFITDDSNDCLSNSLNALDIDSSLLFSATDSKILFMIESIFATPTKLELYNAFFFGFSTVLTIGLASYGMGLMLNFIKNN